MSRVELKVMLKGDRVTLKIARRWSLCGPIKERQSVTLDRRELERALREAEITVPWSEVKS